MTPEQRVELHAICAAASFGTWHFSNEITEPDRQFLFHARTALPAALDALDAADEALAVGEARIAQLLKRNAELEVGAGNDDSWSRQCDENARLESECASYRKLLNKWPSYELLATSYADVCRIRDIYREKAERLQKMVDQLKLDGAP